MKSVLGLMGSPRKNGNTHLLLSRILAGSKTEGASTEMVFLADLSIEQCDGCLVCWQGLACPKQDDMNGLYQQISASDIIVFGTPVYWYGPTALMKGLIDRLVYFNCPENRQKIRNKLAILAIPYEDETPETAALLVTFFNKCLAYLEMNLIGQVLVPGVSKKGDILAKQESLAEGYRLGQRAVR